VQAGQTPALDRNYTTFPQQTRKLASPDVLARGKGLYSVNCSACHGADLRGGDQGGPNLLRSLTALSDQHGELISPIIHGARQDKGMPAFNLSDADSTAVAEYIHSALALVGPKARPPGKADITDKDVLVGKATAGQTYFAAHCASCHSVTGDLKDMAAKYKDPRALQNAWVAGGTVMGRGGMPTAGPRGKPSTVTVTFTDGEKLEGALIRKDDFIVTLLLADGERRSISLESGEAPRVEIHDPLDAHRELARNLSDNDMHNVTAYLATIR
jgi:cytochrome c oxidase cbb3-type subunit 3